MPTCETDHIRIQVHACGLNRADIFQRQGRYPAPEGASDIPGLEVAGVVESVGRNVSQFETGQRVCALLEGGGYAEYVSVRASQVLPTPAHLTDEQAAALPEAFFTVWYNLFEKANLLPEETLLVHGGSSGIGVAAIALCKLLGIRCIVTTTHQEKAKSLDELGAAHVVYVGDGSMVEEVKALTQGKGINVILDMIGGDYAAQNLKMLAYGGRLAIIALVGGAKAEINLGSLLLKNLTVTGATLRNQSAEIKANIASSLRQTLWPLIEKQHYLPAIDKVFAFDDALKAQHYMEENRHIGKIILQLR